MKKLMWSGVAIESIMFIVIIILLCFGRPISDLVFYLYLTGMLICVISSLFVNKNTVKKSNY